MFNEAFHLHQMVPAGKFLNDFIQVNVLAVLNSATWIRLAVRKGRPVGIIAAMVEGQKKHANAKNYRGALARTGARFLFYDYKGLERAAENSFTLKNGAQATPVTGFVYVGETIRK
ncbi:hypothetical protein J2S70_000313 [Trueperella bonasi]|uniref:Methyltransferase n=1 Tax=Trueperella bonasi TaxID=312286 RepID=A0ABT9NEC1_9ACTO|nr:hypothetical protein [Trueperella bonasi]MDP9805731.1 hypothetical protein [Trueperella bonasi]